EDSIRLAEQSLRDEATVNARAVPLDNLVLALACWEMGKKEEAKVCLQRAKDWRQEPGKDRSALTDVLAVQVLLAEAQGVVK
ncbi:MAG: hypothetical protein AB7K24_26690, partial [Gemmataceae bacterium]